MMLFESEKLGTKVCVESLGIKVKTWEDLFVIDELYWNFYLDPPFLVDGI